MIESCRLCRSGNNRTPILHIVVYECIDLNMINKHQRAVVLPEKGIHRAKRKTRSGTDSMFESCNKVVMVAKKKLKSQYLQEIQILI